MDLRRCRLNNRCNEKVSKGLKLAETASKSLEPPTTNFHVEAMQFHSWDQASMPEEDSGETDFEVLLSMPRANRHHGPARAILYGTAKRLRSHREVPESLVRDIYAINNFAKGVNPIGGFSGSEVELPDRRCSDAEMRPYGEQIGGRRPTARQAKSSRQAAAECRAPGGALGPSVHAVRIFVFRGGQSLLRPAGSAHPDAAADEASELSPLARSDRGRSEQAMRHGDNIGITDINHVILEHASVKRLMR